MYLTIHNERATEIYLGTDNTRVTHKHTRLPVPHANTKSHRNTHKQIHTHIVIHIIPPLGVQDLFKIYLQVNVPIGVVALRIVS